MLQIIGWLGCVYLMVKALEIGSATVHRDKLGDMTPTAVVAVLVAGGGALAFGVWLFVQGGGLAVETESPDLISAQVECVTKAATSQERLACYQ